MVKTLIHSGKVGLEGLKWEDRAEQPAGPFEIKIKVKAAGLNHRDLFALSQVHEKHPVVIGSDAAGVVVAVGAEVTRFKIGDEVMLYPGSGWRKNSDTAPENFTILGSSEQGRWRRKSLFPKRMLSINRPICLGKKPACCLCPL